MSDLLCPKLTELGYDFIALSLCSNSITKISIYYIIHLYDFLYIEGERTHPLLHLNRLRFYVTNIWRYSCLVTHIAFVIKSHRS